MSDLNILPRDQNHVTTAGFENSLVSGDVRPGQIVVATGRIKVDFSGGGSGTVTEVDTGTGLTGGPITTTGTISLDSKLAPLDTLGSAGQLIRVNAGATALEYFTASAGGVTSVVGTTNRISVDSSTPSAPVVDIAATYVGQTSITTLGTIGTGTWAGTTIAVNHGGTGGTVASITLFNNITGFSAAGTTGTTSTNLVFSTSPSLTTPTLGVATATSINKVAITAPATSATLTIADGKTLTVSNTLTFTGTDSSSVAFGTGGTVLYTGSTIPLTVGSSTITSGTNTRILYDNSGVLGEYTITGSGTVVVMATAPTITTSVTVPLVIGGSGTTGTQLSLQTTTGNGTTDALVIKGGNNGATTFATFSAALLALATGSITMTGSLAATGARVTKGWFTDIESTNVPTVGGVALPTASSTTTFTNKRVTRRSATTNAPGATPTTNSDNVDLQIFTGLGAAITSMSTNLSGTPSRGDFLEFNLTDDGTARAITWGASFVASTVALPTTTVISTMLAVLFEWNGSAWRCVAVA